MLPIQLRNLALLLHSGRQQKVVDECRRLLKKFPGQPDALHLMAVAYAQLKQFGLSLEYFEQAVGAAPGRFDFWGNYAHACWECGRLERAGTLVEQAISLSPNSPELHNIKGNILLSQSRLTEAEKEFLKAINLQPGYAHALNNLGNTLQKQGRNEKAIAVYQDLLRAYPEYVDAWLNIASAYKAQHDFHNAHECFREALKLQPGLENARVGLAETSPVWSSTLEGRRLILRRQDDTDAEFLASCYSSIGFMDHYNRYIPRFRHPDVLRGQLKTIRERHPVQMGGVDWVILKKSNEAPIGVASLTDIHGGHRRGEFLLGIPLESERINGIGIEAALLILDFSFNRVGLNKLTSIVYADNVAAQKNTLSLGFYQEAYLRSHLIETGTAKCLDLVGYGMLVSDFRSNKRIAHVSLRLLGKDITKEVRHSQ